MKLKFIYATLALLLLFSCSVEDNLESLMQDNNEIVTYKFSGNISQTRATSNGMDNQHKICSDIKNKMVTRWGK